MTDYPTTKHVEVESTAQLREALTGHDCVRLIGTGSQQRSLPAPGVEVTTISTARMNRILRLEADDLTCSVEPGVKREDLDAALAPHRLVLPCLGTGTLGGIFAADSEGPAAPAGPEPRSLLLGLSGMLADGMKFKSGAMVVKSVAGFDLQKLFVGSRGRLFAVTALHLKLRPMARAELTFRNEDLPISAAIDLATALRCSQTPPRELGIEGLDDRFTVTGRLEGEAHEVRAFATTHGLKESGTTAPPTDLAVGQAAGQETETVQGQLPLTRIQELVNSLPSDTPFRFAGTRFTVRMPPEQIDTLLATLPTLGGHGEIRGGSTARRGHRTPIHPTINRLENELRMALDPQEVLR